MRLSAAYRKRVAGAVLVMDWVGEAGRPDSHSQPGVVSASCVSRPLRKVVRNERVLYQRAAQVGKGRRRTRTVDGKTAMDSASTIIGACVLVRAHVPCLTRIGGETMQ
jgi:hypothetical protein